GARPRAIVSCRLPSRTVQSAHRTSPMETYTLRPRPDARADPRYRIDYAGELNRTQYEAATTLEGPVLVIAGAGSGKTRTLVYRVARLVESGVNPAHIEDLEHLGLEYARYKREKNLVDYDDLLVLLRDLLRDHPEVAAQLSRTYRFIMVDEYQDTNPLQAEIVRGLASAHPNVMAVGDDSQSIYSFRGATFRNIMDFPKAFPDT